jgi:hypothetical protein
MQDLVQGDEPLRLVLDADERVLWRSRPGARALFLSVLPRLIRDLVFLAFVAAALVLAGRETEVRNLAIVALLVPVLLWSLWRSLREATASQVSCYTITDRRLIISLPRAAPPVQSINLRGGRVKDPALTRILAVDRRAIRNGRATIRLKVRGLVNGRNSNVRFWMKSWLKLHGVSGADEAVRLLRKWI